MIKVVVVTLAILLLTGSAQNTCQDNSLKQIATGLVTLGAPNATSAQTSYVQTLSGTMGVYAQVFSAFAIAGVQAVSQQKYYSLVVDQVYFQNSNTKMRFTMDYLYNETGQMYQSQWVSLTLSYIVVSSQFEAYNTVVGGNYIWAGASDLIVDVTGNFGVFPQGSIFDSASSVAGIAGNNVCGYLGRINNNNSPVFDYICDGTASNDQIIPHFYIMGVKFVPGSYELAASAIIANYYSSNQPTAQFGTTKTTGFGPLVQLNSYGGSLMRVKVGIVLTVVKNLFTGYPNTLQSFQYSQIYTNQTLFNAKTHLGQPNPVVAGSANKYQYPISSIKYRIFGFSSFAIAKLPSTSTTIDMNINIPDLYTLYVQTDNTDYLSNVVVASDMFVLNDGSLCGGSTQPSIDMVNIAQKVYKSIPDLAPQQQNIQQTSNTPLLWALQGYAVTNGSDLVTFSVEIDFTNFTAGNSYLISTSLSALNNLWSTVLPANGYVKYSIQVENNTVNQIIINSTNPATNSVWNSLLNTYDYDFGINIATANPKIIFTLIIPRPTGVGTVFEAQIQLQIKQYSTLFNPNTGCCVDACSPGQGINIQTSPATCIDCSSAQSLVFDSNSGACQCQTGYYNLLSGSSFTSSGTGISCFPCMGQLCATCTVDKPAVCTTCVMGANFDSNGVCNCLTGYFEVGGVSCQSCSYKCATCSVSGSCNTCSDPLRDINSNCSCPNGYYDDGTTQCKVCNSICKTCSSSTQCTSCFSQNNRTISNGQCVCADGFYQQILQNNSVICSRCNSQCAQCTGPDTCSNCSSSSNRILGYDSAGHQTCSCLPGYSSIADGSCVQNGCTGSAYCSNCNQVNGTSVCIKCIASTNRYLAIPQYACLCNSGYYQSNGACVACGSGCATCTNATTCTSCVVSALSNNNGTCNCPPNFFFATLPIRYCQKCSDYCVSCTSLTTCNTCFTGFTKLSNGSCICPKGNYVQPNTLKCIPCVSGCSICNSSTSCQNCALPLLSQNGSCVTRCNIGFFAAGQTCTACSSGCTYCEKADSCQICNPGLYMYRGACYVNCGVGNSSSDGSYGTIVSTNDSTCIACNSPCQTCVQHPSKCLTCLQGQGNFYQYQCLASCPVGTYANNGVCEFCSFSCAACLGAADICISCPTGQYLFQGACFSQCPVNLINGVCPNQCPSGFFTAADGSCNQCSSNCVSCQNSASFCTQCQGSLVAFNGTCVQSCPVNSYLSNGNCVQCVNGCNKCSGNPNNCSACVGGFFLSGSVCVASCGNASYYDTASSSCKPCPSNCKSCTASNFCTSCVNALSNPVNGVCYNCIYPCTTCSSYEVCSACLTGFNLLNTSCTTSCPSGSSSVNGVCTCNNGFFQNGVCVSSCSSGFTNVAGSCIKCDSNCAQCLGSSTKCVSCPNGSNLDQVSGICVVNKNCAVGQYFSSQNNICTRICPSGLSYQDSMCLSQCLQGFIDNGFGGCVVQPQTGGCSYPYFLDQGVCVSTCSVGTFPNSQSRVCQACSSNCFSCLSNTFCTSCNSGFDVNKGICITGSNCASGLYKLNGVCVQSCPIGTFLSSGYCQRICPAGTYYYMQGCYDVCPSISNLTTNDACVSSCPSGTSLNNGTCQTNSQSCPTGQFYNSQTQACAACTYPCTNCQFTPSYCTACSSGLVLNSNRCVASTGCSGSTYRNANGSCNPCPSKCQTCVSATECSTCASGYQFNGYDCVVALSNLKTVTLAQSSISKRDSTVFISIKLSLIPNGLTSAQINSFFIVVPSVADTVVKINQWQDTSDNTVAWIAIQYNPIPTLSTAFITINAQILAASYANVGYTAGDNFLAVSVSQAIATTPSSVIIPASATNSIADSGSKIPAGKSALTNALKQDSKIF